MTFDIEKYREQQLKLMKQAADLSTKQVRDKNPYMVGRTDEYDEDRVDCMCWEMDKGFVTERIYEDSLSLAEEAEEYIQGILREGPKCKYCLWNDGGDKSCVHPMIEDCKHPTVEVEIVWTEERMRTAEFSGIDWKKGTFKGYRETTEPETFDGTASRVYSVKCSTCHTEVETWKIDKELLDAFADEWLGERE